MLIVQTGLTLKRILKFHYVSVLVVCCYLSIFATTRNTFYLVYLYKRIKYKASKSQYIYINYYTQAISLYLIERTSFHAICMFYTHHSTDVSYRNYQILQKFCNHGRSTQHYERQSISARLNMTKICQNFIIKVIIQN